MAIEHRYPLLQQGLLGSKILGASATLTGTDSGKAYTNASATGSITVNLPSATAGRVFQFLVVAAQTMVIHPTSVDSIRGTGAGVSKTLAGTPGTLLYLECIVAGTWEILNSGGGGSGTVTSVAITGTDGSIIVNSGSPITGSGTIDLSAAPSISQFNLTPDSHALLPTGVGVGPNDEFEFGSSLDTAGARYASATAWAWLNQGSVTSSIGAGAIAFTGMTDGLVHAAIQPVPATPYAYTAKIAGAASAAGTGTAPGIIVYNSGTSRLYQMGFNTSGSAPVMYAFNSPISFNGTVGIAAAPVGYTNTTSVDAANWSYVRVTNNGTSIIYSISKTGLPGTFFILATVALATFIAAVTHVGVVFNNNVAAASTLYDWFRRTA